MASANENKTYTTYSIPKTIDGLVVKFLKKSKYFTSRSEFTKYAIVRELERQNGEMAACVDETTPHMKSTP